jgi:predicted acetyltransferase
MKNYNFRKTQEKIEKFYLEEPNISRKDEAIEYINEFTKYNSEVAGSGSLDKYLKEKTYEKWLEFIINMKSKDYACSINFVPSTTYFLIRENDNKIVGMINIRLELNDNLKRRGGHIGYSIRPTERRKGYNKINLYLGLLKCQEYNIKEVMLSCNKNNLGSSRTMIALGGNLLKEYYIDEDNILEQIYSIDVDKSLKEYFENYKSLIK